MDAYEDDTDETPVDERVNAPDGGAIGGAIGGSIGGSIGEFTERRVKIEP